MPRKSPYPPPSTGRVPKVRRIPAIPKGPREFSRLTALPASGPGEPPVDFAVPGLGGPGGTFDEWYCYWGLAKVMRDPKDPRKGPFTGGIDWTYQQAVLLPGQLVPREAGSDVVDFVVFHNGATVAIRVQSALHTMDVFGDFAKVRARDQLSKSRLTQFDMVVDVFSQHFIDDPTGQKVCQVMREAIRGYQRPDPVAFGQARQVHPIRRGV